MRRGPAISVCSRAGQFAGGGCSSNCQFLRKNLKASFVGHYHSAEAKSSGRIRLCVLNEMTFSFYNRVTNENGLGSASCSLSGWFQFLCRNRPLCASRLPRLVAVEAFLQHSAHARSCHLSLQRLQDSNWQPGHVNLGCNCDPFVRALLIARSMDFRSLASQCPVIALTEGFRSPTFQIPLH
jgi:hypothetical protein